MKRGSGQFLDLFVRYALLILIAFPGLWIFYLIFTPLTIHPTYFLLNLFFDASLLAGNIILVNREIPIEMIRACIAGSAYYLLTILNLATPKIELKQRINMLLLAFGVFLVLNLLRILLLSFLAVSGSSIFDVTHKIFWYSLSTIFVVAIWFAEVKLFKIREIPFYSDIKFLYKTSRLKR
jgi:exosortase/archaeosortase family protein